jgi:hypothetical protein
MGELLYKPRTSLFDGKKESAKEDRPSFPVGSRVKHSHAPRGLAGIVEQVRGDQRCVSWDYPNGENSCWVDAECLMWESDK